MVASNPAKLIPDLSAESRHRPELDGIRGIAIVAVLLTHGSEFIRPSTHLSHVLMELMVPGWSGVELFFALSGFLITGILLRTKTAGNYFSSFYMRRILRIFPIYYFALTIAIVAAAYVPWWDQAIAPAGKSRVAFYFYLQNWPMFWQHGIETRNAIGHFWTLAVEEQFYLVWPLIVLFLPKRGLLALCGIGLIGALVGRIVHFYFYGEVYGFIHLTTSRVDGLLVGSALAVLSQKRPIPLRWIYTVLAIAGSVILYIAFFHRGELVATNRYMETVGYAAFAWLSGGLIALSQYPMLWLQRVLRMSALTVTGKYSYGIYVYHVPVYVILWHYLPTWFGYSVPLPLGYALPWLAIAMAVSFFIAKLSFDFFESKILALKKHFKPQLEVNRVVAQLVE